MAFLYVDCTRKGKKPKTIIEAIKQKQKIIVRGEISKTVEVDSKKGVIDRFQRQHVCHFIYRAK